MSNREHSGHRGLRLLIVDEDAESRAALSQAFTQHGHACTVAATASEARAAVRSLVPDAVVLDWVFQDASGVGLASMLRADAAAAGRTIRIIALSVWDEPYGFAASEGIDRYFVKPASMAELERALRALA